MSYFWQSVGWGSNPLGSVQRGLLASGPGIWRIKYCVKIANVTKATFFSDVFLPFHPNPQMVSTLKLRMAKDLKREKESREEKVIEGTVPAVSEWATGWMRQSFPFCHNSIHTTGAAGQAKQSYLTCNSKQDFVVLTHFMWGIEIWCNLCKVDTGSTCKHKCNKLSIWRQRFLT